MEDACTSTMDWSSMGESSEDDDDDEVLAEMDVFMSNTQHDSTYLLQYPLRPSDQRLSMGVEKKREITCEFKPKQEKLQIKLPLDTSSCSYDKGRGEQIAINCGASSSSAATASKNKPAAPFEKAMDYQCLVSQNAGGFHTNCYAVGYLQNGQLHLNPFKNVLQMKPTFSYLDAADAKSSTTSNSSGGQVDTGDSSQDESETEAGPSGTSQVQTVRVKFKEESEWLRKRREASYQYQQKIKDEEPWIPLAYVPAEDESTVDQRALLLGNIDRSLQPSVSLDEIDVKSADGGSSQLMPSFNSEAIQLFNFLVPKAEEQKTSTPRLSSAVIPLKELSMLPLPDQVRTLLTNVKVMQFSQLLSRLPPKADVKSVLHFCQAYAQLVRGCWVVKSEILHPKGSFSPRTGASADLLCRARDYAMFKFTQTQTITRREIAAAVKIPNEDIDDILNQLAKFKIQCGWQFMYPVDTEFLQSYPEIAQLQMAKWEAKFKDLSQHLTIANRQRQTSTSSIPSPGARRRRTDSGRNSITESGDHDARLMSPPPMVPPAGQRSRRRSSSGAGAAGNSRKRTASNSSSSSKINNGLASGKITTELLTVDPATATELKNFLYDALCQKPVLSLARLKLQLQQRISELAKDHPLTKGADERIIEVCAAELGVTKFDKGQGEHSERTILVYGGGSWPEIREYFIKYVYEKSKGKKEKAAIRFNAFKEACINGGLSPDYSLPSDTEMKQLILEYCVQKAGGYYGLQDG